MKFHVGLNLKGVLSNNDYMTLLAFKDEKGKTVSRKEAKNFLLDELSKGRLFIPMGECDNFDTNKGCRGHKEP